MLLSDDVQDLVLARLQQLHPEAIEWKQEKKALGRHAGSVFVAGDLRYFVKQQRFCIRTLYLYHLLSAIGCGPRYFFVLAYRRPGEEEFAHIIATRAVPDFRMASEEKNDDCILSPDDAMCLLLLVCFFGLGDIPSNTDNWGTASGRRLALVDFSFGVPQGLHCVSIMSSLRNFVQTCRPLIIKSRPEGEAEAMMSSFLRTYAQQFGNQQAFDRLQEYAMAHVIDWVNDDTSQKEWRQAQSVRCSFYLLEELVRFQSIARKQFETFISWQ